MQQQNENDPLLCVYHVKASMLCCAALNMQAKKYYEKKKNRGLLQATATMTPITIGQLTNKLFISLWMLNVEH